MEVGYVEEIIKIQTFQNNSTTNSRNSKISSKSDFQELWLSFPFCECERPKDLFYETIIAWGCNMNDVVDPLRLDTCTSQT
jgi:hypothetical protein